MSLLGLDQALKYSDDGRGGVGWYPSERTGLWQCLVLRLVGTRVPVGLGGP